MTDKAYIVANEQQEREVLEKLEREGYRWFGNEELTEWVPSRDDICFVKFPLALISHKNKYVLKNLMQDNYELNILERCEVAFDGRKESKMKINRDVYDALVEWKKMCDLGADIDVNFGFVSSEDIEALPDKVHSWWRYDEHTFGANNRLIAIIRWVNGEDVFEVEKPKKWVVRSKETDDDNDHWYVRLPNNIDGINDVVYYMSSATLFNTKEEAQSWANSHQEVVEVEE